MRTNKFSTSVISWTAIATGVSVILAVLFILPMATVEPRFGKLNDVFNAIIGIASGVLASMLYPQHRARSPLISQIGLGLALAGVIVTIVGSVLIIFDFTGYVLAGFYTGLGNALIGLWLVAFSASMQRADILPHNLVMFGLVAGAIMALGVLDIAGILTGIDSMDSLSWYLFAGFLGFIGTYILYPIWTIWLGREIRSGARSG